MPQLIKPGVYFSVIETSGATPVSEWEPFIVNTFGVDFRVNPKAMTITRVDTGETKPVTIERDYDIYFAAFKI